MRYDVSTEKTVNSTRKMGRGRKEVTEGISNRKELSDTLGYDTTRMVKRMVEWRKQFASCKSVTRNTVLSMKNFPSTDYDNCCLYQTPSLKT